MKIYIKSAYFYSEGNMVEVSTSKRGDDAINIFRSMMRKLLRGSGKRLPQHGSDEIVEIELIAK